MNETQVVDAGPKLPRQVTAFANEARDLLKAGQEPPAQDPPAEPPAPGPAAAVPAPQSFTYEQLLNAPDSTRDNDPAYWRARCNIIEGFRREDVRKGKEKVERLEDEIRKLTEKNAELIKNHPAAQPKIDLAEHFAPDVLERIGEENASAIAQAAQKIADKLVASEIEKAVKPLLNAQKEKDEDSAKELQRKFVKALTDGFPNWQEVDKDARWLVYLEQVDPVSRMTRQQIVDRCKANRDAEGIVNMLKAFMLSLSPIRVPADPPETPPPIEGNGSEGPRGDGVVTDSRPMTEAEIKAGYKAKLLGKMTAKEAAAFDARVEAMMARKGAA